MSFLREKKMTTIFGNPGSTELPMFRNFPDDFHYVLALQESVAVGMADGYAQVADRPAVVSLHSAAGVGHAMGAIFTAWCNRTPLIVVAGQQSRSLLLHAPFLMSDRASELAQPYVKFALEPARAKDVPMAMARAWYHSMQHPRGPVLLSIPVDDWDQAADPVPPRGQPIGPGTPDLTQVVDAISRAEAPALVVGGEVDRCGAWRSVVALAERMGAPVWQATMEGRLGFPQDHPNFAGVLPSVSDGVRARLQDHDLIISLGARTFTYHIEGREPSLPASTMVFQIGNDPLYGAAAPTGQAFIADIGATISVLLEAIPGGQRPISSRQNLVKDQAAVPKMDIATVLRFLNRSKRDDSIIVEEAATARIQMPQNLPITAEASYICAASGGLGFGLPAVVGAALADPSRRVIGLIGDGSAMYSIQALFSAARENANVAIIILNNGRYAALDDFGKIFGMTDLPGLDIRGINFVNLANSQGVPATCVSDVDDLQGAIDSALQRNGPYLLEIGLE